MDPVAILSSQGKQLLRGVVGRLGYSSALLRAVSFNLFCFGKHN